MTKTSCQWKLTYLLHYRLSKNHVSVSSFQEMFIFFTCMFCKNAKTIFILMLTFLNSTIMPLNKPIFTSALSSLKLVSQCFIIDFKSNIINTNLYIISWFFGFFLQVWWAVLTLARIIITSVFQDTSSLKWEISASEEF